MSRADRDQRAYWDGLSQIDPDAAIIDPNDRRGLKNRYLAGMRDEAFRSSLCRHGLDDCVLLDLGCGTGSSTQPLLKAGYSVLGIDISLGLLRHAKVRCGDKHCLFIATDGSQLPIADATVDAAVVYVVLSYLVDDDRARALLESVRRSLKPNAPLIMIEQARTQRRTTEAGLKVQRSRPEWLALLSSAGFKVDSSHILRHGRFPTTPLIRAGWLPPRLWPHISRLEARIAAHTGVLPWDYAEILFEARA
ncbi:class I SAM-dependent methyltransferase [Lysobacter gummosus]|uniref:class I SAM-dependent methyltransferase n=1 Tax=Lysobacter gummosus TaxID=262324 RepID=UPI00363532E9